MEAANMFGRNLGTNQPVPMPVGDWSAEFAEVDSNLTALNDTVTYTPPAGAQTLAIYLRGPAVMSTTVEGTIDGTNWFTLSWQLFSFQAALSIYGYPFQFRVPVVGLAQVRVRCSAYTSGSVAVSARFSPLPLPATPAGLGVDTEISAAAALSDALANPTAGLIGAVMMDFNGSTVERYRHNESRSLYASAARTAAPASTDQTTFGGIALIVSLVVSAASGTGGLTVIIEGKDANDTYYTLLQGPLVTAVNTSTPLVLVVDPRIVAVANSIAQRPLPRTWRVRVTHGDASSYTYAVGADLV